MALKDELQTAVTAIFKDSWSQRDGTAVPTDSSLTLGNDAINLEATVLYADLSDSTQLVDGYKNWFAAEVYKAFLRCAARIIHSEGGQVVAYDGDRVMAIYIGEMKNTRAVKTALKIKFACDQIIQPSIKSRHPETPYVIKHTVGIDTSKLFVARAGIRGANDLVWIGRAANYAAKLCALSHDTPTWITKAVYDGMAPETRVTNGNAMWKLWKWTPMNSMEIYSSTWHWAI